MARRMAPVPITTNPRVTVVVPCYNYGHFLPDCVNSILEQPGVTPDVIIVDDASPDGSGEVADALAAQHAQVRTIRHEVNKRHIATYNDGLSQAEGDYVVLISADDLLAPGALQRATAVMETNPDVGLVYGNPVVFTGNPPAESTTSVRNWTVWKGDEWAGVQCRVATSLITSPESVVRASVQHQVGYYLPALPHSGDLEMWLRIAAVSDIGRVNGADQAFKRMHGNNMIITEFPSIVADLVERRKAYETFFDGYGTKLANRDSMRRAVSRRLAIEALESVCANLARGETRAELLDPAVEFAQDIYPDYAGLGAWREVTWRRGLPAAPDRRDRLRSSVQETRRDLLSRVRWHRWHRYGT